jgi:hypothetical protein
MARLGNSSVAYECVPFVNQNFLKIECLDLYNTLLLVGTQEGHLLVYDVCNTETNKTKTTPSPKMSFQAFGKRSISQLTAVAEHSILISLLDGCVCVHSLPSFQPLAQLKNTKGALFYREDRGLASDRLLRLCVVLKHKLLIYVWQNREFKEVKELAVPHSVKAVAWCTPDKLCVGFQKEYVFIQISTGMISSIELAAGGTTKPLVLSLPNQQLLLQRDNTSIFVNYEGKGARKFGISWNESPIAIAYAFPYVIALLSKSVEVRMCDNQLVHSAAQYIPLIGPKAIAVPPQHKMPRVGNVYVANQTDIYVLRPVPLTSRVDQMINEREYKEALSLCMSLTAEEIPNWHEKIRNIKILDAYDLFNRGQYREAFEYFLSENMDPLQVIGLYKLLPASLVEKYHYPFRIDDLKGAGLNNALMELSTYLVQKRSDLKLGLLPPGPQQSWDSTTDVAQIIDTTLLKTYLKINPRLISSFLRLPNHCHVQECEACLRKEAKYQELVDLYKSKGLHREALTLLRTLADPLRGPSSLPFVPPELQSTTPTVNYLRSLSDAHLDLILEFSTWVLIREPTEALNIFVVDRSSNTQLPFDRILIHLKTVCPQQVVPFLEYIIQTLGVKRSEFHNELLSQYIDQLKKLTPSASEYALFERKLLAFLTESSYYTPEKILSRYNLRADGLHEANALLLSRLGQHDLALEVYVYDLRDLKKAEEYCVKQYHPEHEETRELFFILLRIYLGQRSPPTTSISPASFSSSHSPSTLSSPLPLDSAFQERLRNAAFDVLNRYTSRLNCLKVVGLLGNETSLTMLVPFFQASFRYLHQRRRESQVMANIAKYQAIKVKRQLFELQSRVVRITNKTVCIVCKKSIGATTAFAAYSNGNIAHYKCFSGSL